MDNYPKYISQEQQELFEKYLMNTIGAEEKVTLESRLKEDSKLNGEFKEFKSLFRTIEEAGLKEKMNDFHKEFQLSKNEENNSKKSFPFKVNYGIAASIAVLLAVGGIWFFANQNPNKKLFNEYFSPDPGLPTVMGNSNNYDFYEAMVDYKQGKYEVAIDKWEGLLAMKPENDTLNYFVGIANLANGNTQIAVDYLRKTASDKNSHFNNEALYYLGLGELKLNNREKAKTLLESANYEKSNEISSKLTN